MARHPQGCQVSLCIERAYGAAPWTTLTGDGPLCDQSRAVGDRTRAVGGLLWGRSWTGGGPVLDLWPLVE
jgi:hypothetical protein